MTARTDSLAGTTTLVRFALRRDRARLAGWAVGLGGFMAYAATVLPTVYDTTEDLRSATQLYADPVGRMFVGPGYGFDAVTYERFVANGYGLYLFLLVALMNILLMTRHTRAEEQSGRAELVRANVVGRHTTLTAALITAVVSNVVVSAAVTAALIVIGGYGVDGAVLLGAATAATGLAFAGVSSITVQVAEYSRAASAAAGAVLGAAFVLRAGGDMATEGGNILSWLSPLGWGQQTAPYVLDRWWPLALPLALAAVTTITGYALSTRRDLGASLTSVRPGPPRAHPLLGTPWGLALRLQRSAIIGWAIALTVAGLTFGAFADSLQDAADDMPGAFTDLFGTDDMLAGYLGYTSVFMSIVVAVYVVLAIQGLHAEETAGRAEPVLATPVHRGTWLGAHQLIIAAGAVLITVAAGASTGIGAALVTGETRHIGDLIVAHLNHLPAVLTLLGLAGLLYGALPRAIPVTWLLIGYGLVMVTFGQLLDLPQPLANLSPFAHLAQMPLDPFRTTPLIILLVLATVTAAVGLASFRQRDLHST